LLGRFMCRPSYGAGATSRSSTARSPKKNVPDHIEMEKLRLVARVDTVNHHGCIGLARIARQRGSARSIRHAPPTARTVARVAACSSTAASSYRQDSEPPHGKAEQVAYSSGLPK
jgi:hypothetical protein